MNNQTRAHAALCAIAVHQETKGVKAETEIYDEDVTDLLADIMHFCQHNKIDFDQCLSMATDHYGEEK